MLNKLDILSGVDPLLHLRRLRDRRTSASRPGRRAAPRSRARRRSTRSSPGWTEPIHAVRSLGDLPENARRYVSAIEEPRRRADRARVGRAGADPDHRAGLPADAPAPGDPGMSGAPRDADADPHRRERGPGARARLEAERRAGRQHGVRRARQRRDGRRTAGAPPRRTSIHSMAARSWRPRGPSPPSSSSSGRRRRWRPGSRTRSGRPASRSSGRAPPRPGSSRARRSATRSRPRPGSRWRAPAPSSRRRRPARSPASSTPKVAGSSSRPTAWPRARA